MKKLLSISVLMLLPCYIFSQTAENPFKKLGYDVLVATSSRGEFEEFHDRKEIVEIGSVYFNTKTKEIVGFVDEEKSSTEISSTTIAMSIDPLCEQYYWISPYAYVANNPIKFIDPDGRKIVQYNYTHYKNDGTIAGKVGLSKTTQAAMTDYVKTAEGRAFLAQYATAGDVVGGYKFEKSGSFADQTFEIRDISLENQRGQIIPSGDKGSIGSKVDKDGKATVTLKIHSLGYSKEDIVETTAHELQVHGYKLGDKIAGKKVTTEGQDHQAIKNKDTKHQGYKKYDTVRKQLEVIDSKYKSVFQKADKEYQEKY